MRKLALGLLVALLAIAPSCFDGLAPPRLLDDDGGLILPAGDGGADLSASVDLLSAGDGGPTACVTACDCSPGDRCEKGQCRTTAIAVYCCGSTTCPGSNLCQQPDGKVNQCDLSPDAAVTPAPGDGGTVTGCAAQACTKGPAGTLLCKLACGSVTADCIGNAGSGEHCSP